MTDRGDVRGVTFGNREAQLVLNVARNNCVPHLQPRTETVELDGKTVAVIRVERGRQKPYQANERIYVRIGASTRAATQVELLSMLQESGLLSFDQLVEEAFAVLKRLLGLSYLWTGSLNGVLLQVWSTWLFYTILIDLADAVAEELMLPFDRISLEMVFRGLPSVLI